MKKLLLIIVLIFIAFTVTFGLTVSIRPIHESFAVRALENEGFHDIVITDRVWPFAPVQGCGLFDTTAYNAVAKNPDGKTVRVYVCLGGLFGPSPHNIWAIVKVKK